MTAPNTVPNTAPNIVLLGSTRGSSMQATLTAIAHGHINATICAVLSDKSDAPILQRADTHNIPNTAIVPLAGENRRDFDRRMIQEIDIYRPDMVLMVGYMRIVSPEFCTHYKNKLFNIHPSLLPLYGGLMDMAVHQAVLDNNETQSGCTIHRVTKVVDTGQNVIQYPCAVYTHDTADTLKHRVQGLESRAWIHLIQDWKKYV